jgi:diguanylate cyclase (GGDEF)-like protein
MTEEESRDTERINTAVVSPDEVATDPPTEVTRIDDIVGAMSADRWTLTILSGESAGLVLPLQDQRMTVGRGGDADVRLLDQGLSREHAAFEPQGDQIRIVDLGSTNGTFVEGEKISGAALVGDGARVQLATVAMRLQLQTTEEMAAVRRIYESTIKDSLTGLSNRRHLEEQLDREYAFAIRHRVPLSVLMIDVDHFKKVNDTYGHPVGDSVLVALAAYLIETVRQEDIVGRYGGEEFVVALRDVGAAGAQVLAERIRQGIEETGIEAGGDSIRVTVSIGVATYDVTRPYADHNALVEVADKCLYRAKANGRNIVIADASPRSVPPTLR